MKQYIGDGVYVDDDQFDVVLTTENGVATTNRIVLEREVLAELQRWLAARSERRITRAPGTRE